MEHNCIFCKIVNKQASADLVYEDDLIIVFKDLVPKAKVHLLLIPKIHIASLAEINVEHEKIMLHALYKIPEIAKSIGINGFRTIINTGKEGGQIIDHLHFHILSPVK